MSPPLFRTKLLSYLYGQYLLQQLQGLETLSLQWAEITLHATSIAHVVKAYRKVLSLRYIMRISISHCLQDF
jgi:hypothetical protein